MRLSIARFVGIAGAALCAGTAWAQVTSSVIAIDGQVVSGKTLAGVQTPTIAPDGTVVVNSWAGVLTVPFLDAQQTTFYPSPRFYANAPTQQVQFASTAWIADGGMIAGNSSSGIPEVHLGPPASPTRLAALTSCGCTAGLTFAQLSQLSLGRGGRVVFAGKSTILANGFNGMWWADASAPGGPVAALALQTGDAAPGIEGGPSIGEIGSAATVNASGMIAFQAHYTTPTGMLPTVFFGQPSVLAPAAALGEVINGRTLTTALSPRLNDAGTLAYWAAFGQTQAVIRQEGVAREVVAATGDVIAGLLPGETHISNTLGTVGNPILVGNGDVVFGGQLKTAFYAAPLTSVPLSVNALWSCRGPSDCVLICRSGMRHPGHPELTISQYPASLSASASGHVVFQVTLSGPGVTAANVTAIMAFHRGTGLRTVVRRGDVIPLPGGGSGIVQDVFVTLGSGGEDGFASGLSDSGQLVYRVLLTDGRSVVMGVTLPSTPAAGQFSLLAPVEGVDGVSTQPTLSWEPSPNAVSYTVSLTPRDRVLTTLSPAAHVTTRITTTATSVQVPADVIRDCNEVVWSVAAHTAEGGFTISTPPTQSFKTGTEACFPERRYSIEQIGLSGAPNYGASNKTLIGPHGEIAGYTVRSGSSLNSGQDAWLWDSAQTIGPVGLFGSAYEAVSGPSTARFSEILDISASGVLIGDSQRFGGGINQGSDAWVRDASGTRLIGLTGGVYDKPADGPWAFRRNNSTGMMNDAGRIIGSTSRWSSTGAALGFDGWIYDGTTTQRVGPITGVYTFGSGANAQRTSAPAGINASGVLIGQSGRYSSTGDDLGTDSWMMQGTTLTMLTLTGAGYESPVTGGTYRKLQARFLNDAGDVAGIVRRWNAAGDLLGNGIFRWRGGAFQLVDPSDALHGRPVASGGLLRSPSIYALTPNGHIVGTCPRYSAAGESLGEDVWHFDGVQTRVIGLSGPLFQSPATGPENAARKNSVIIGVNDLGQVVGTTRIQSPEMRIWGWIFDPATGVTSELYPSGLPSEISTVEPLGILPSGAVVGQYLYGLQLEYNGVLTTTHSCACGSAYRAFIWTPQRGLVDLGSMVVGNSDSTGWSMRMADGGFGGSATTLPTILTGQGVPIGASGVFTYVLREIAPPSAFALNGPANLLSVATARPTLAWSASPGAASYTVTITPAGGAATVLYTTATVIDVPVGLLRYCDQVTWSVTATNAVGSVESTPAARTFRVSVADFNADQTASVDDLFLFFNAWFTGDDRADIDGQSGVAIDDLFLYINVYFAGC